MVAEAATYTTYKRWELPYQQRDSKPRFQHSSDRRPTSLDRTAFGSEESRHQDVQYVSTGKEADLASWPVWMPKRRNKSLLGFEIWPLDSSARSHHYRVNHPGFQPRKMEKEFVRRSPRTINSQNLLAAADWRFVFSITITCSELTFSTNWVEGHWSTTHTLLVRHSRCLNHHYLLY